jgi:hypothetical protein
MSTTMIVAAGLSKKYQSRAANATTWTCKGLENARGWLGSLQGCAHNREAGVAQPRPGMQERAEYGSLRAASFSRLKARFQRLKEHQNDEKQDPAADDPKDGFPPFHERLLR